MTDSTAPRTVPRPPVPRAPSATLGSETPEPAADLGTEAGEALDALDRLEGAPLAEHVEAFDTVHGLLQERLAEAED